MVVLKIIMNVCCALVFIDCQRSLPTNNLQAESVKTKTDKTVNASNSRSRESFSPDLSSYHRYQTFDEFKMKGIGAPMKEPYVYVKAGKDTIIVRSSDKSDSCRVYLRCETDMWHSHMCYESWKKKGYVMLKEPWERAARGYDRYFYNDTIFECYKSFGESFSHYKYYIKTKDIMIELCSANNSKVFQKPTPEVRRMIKKSFDVLKPYGIIRIDNMKIHYRKYILYEDNEKICYKQKAQKPEYEFIKKAYGLWGIQPGTDERRLVYGQEIDNFNHEHPNGIYTSEIDVYEKVDEMPVFPGGDEALRKYIRNKVSESDMVKSSETVIVGFVITESGTIKDIKIVKTTTNNDKINNHAVDIVKGMPKWTPGLLNGNRVKVRYMIPIHLAYLKTKCTTAFEKTSYINFD